MYFTVVQTSFSICRATSIAPQSFLGSIPPVLKIWSASAHRCCTWQESLAFSCSALSWRSAGQGFSWFCGERCSFSESSRSPLNPFSDRMTVGYKHTWMLGKRYSVNTTYKIFCGWDFTIQDPDSAALKQGFIRNDLKVVHIQRQLQLTPKQILS